MILLCCAAVIIYGHNYYSKPIRAIGYTGEKTMSLTKEIHHFNYAEGILQSFEDQLW